MSLDRSAILALQDHHVRAVAVPEWGGVVHVRTITGAERDQLEARQAKQPKGTPLPNFRGVFAAMVLCDPNGQRLFTDADAEALGAKAAAVLDRIVENGLDLNRIGEAEVQQLAGESAGDRSAASGSGSPSPSA